MRVGRFPLRRVNSCIHQQVGGTDGSYRLPGVRLEHLTEFTILRLRFSDYVLREREDNILREGEGRLFSEGGLC